MIHRGIANDPLANQSAQRRLRKERQNARCIGVSTRLEAEQQSIASKVTRISLTRKVDDAGRNSAFLDAGKNIAIMRQGVNSFLWCIERNSIP